MLQEDSSKRPSMETAAARYDKYLESNQPEVVKNIHEYQAAYAT